MVGEVIVNNVLNYEWDEIDRTFKVKCLDGSRFICHDVVEFEIVESCREHFTVKIRYGRAEFTRYDLMTKTAKETSKIKNVIFNDPATIVFWSDGTKTVVKCGENDIYDPEKGLAMAVAKKYLGTNKSHSNYMDEFKKWLPKEEELSNPIEDVVDSIKKVAEIYSSLKEKEHD